MLVLELEALVLTFMTTPLVTNFYPPRLHLWIVASGANFDNIPDQEGCPQSSWPITRWRIQDALTQLVQPVPPPISSCEGNGSSAHEHRGFCNPSTIPLAISLEAPKLIEFSDRVSDVMKSRVADSLRPLLAISHIFGQLNWTYISPILSAMKFEDLAYSIREHARTYGSDMIMVSWLPPPHKLRMDDGRQVVRVHSAWSPPQRDPSLQLLL